MPDARSNRAPNSDVVLRHSLGERVAVSGGKRRCASRLAARNDDNAPGSSAAKERRSAGRGFGRPGGAMT